MELFKVDRPDLWGDYGDVLISGFSRKEDPRGPILLERTGPFLPPICFPFEAIIVSNALKSKMEASFAGQFKFGRAVYEIIVPIDWHLWSRTAEWPKVRPLGGEPGNYLKEGKHSSKTAQAMDRAWELTLEELPFVTDRQFIDRANSHSLSDPKILFVDRPEYPDLFCSSLAGITIASSFMKSWLEENAAGWVKFSHLKVVHDPGAVQRAVDQRNFNKSVGPHLTCEEYQDRALELCKKKSYAFPDGLSRDGAYFSRYCIVRTDCAPPKLSAKFYDDYYYLEEYIAYCQRVSSSPEKVLSTLLIYDLETGNQLRRLNSGKFEPLAG